MRMRQLLLREIAYRKFNFATGLLCVAVAVACGVGAALLLRAFDRDTDKVLADMQAASKAAWDKYKDEMRKDMLELGFNLMVLHKDQNLSNPDEHGKTLPETHGEKLAAARLKSINHVLPFLQQKFWWPERKRWITLVGTLGEVYIQNPKTQKPMLKEVERGRATLGRAIHESLALKLGDKIDIAGRRFAVQECLGPRGFQEDENIFVPLRDAQELLGQQGRITGILAINCTTCDPETLLSIQRDVQSLLPETRVIEHSTKLIARANVRAKSAREADAALVRERKTRTELRAGRTAFSAVLIGLVAVLSVVFLSLLMWDNVRRRQLEIGILRAIGVTRKKILALFLGKALLIGIIGAAVGYGGGVAVALVRAPGAAARAGLMDPLLLGGSIAGAALLSALASWVPARLAAGIDPAIVLQREGA